MKGLIIYDLIYPGYIGLHDKSSYFFSVDERNYTLLVQEHVKVLKILDFDNELEYENRNATRIKRGIEQKMVSSDIFTLSRYDRPVITVDFKGRSKRVFQEVNYTRLFIGSDEDNVSKPKMNGDSMSRILSHFLRIYRIAGSDLDVLLPLTVNVFNPIDYKAVFEYTSEELKMSVRERMTKTREMTFSGNHLSVNHLDFYVNRSGVPNHDFEVLESKMKKILEHETHIDDVSVFFMEIDDRIKVENNYRMLFLELFILIETMTARVLRKRKLEMGVSKNKLDDAAKSLTMSYMLNVELAVFLNPLSEAEKKIIGKVDNMRRLRNDIVHEGVHVEGTRLQEGRNTAMDFFNMLRARKQL